jgi:hypothetical protein
VEHVVEHLGVQVLDVDAPEDGGSLRSTARVPFISRGTGVQDEDMTVLGASREERVADASICGRWRLLA